MSTLLQRQVSCFTKEHFYEVAHTQTTANRGSPDHYQLSVNLAAVTKAVAAAAAASAAVRETDGAGPLLHKPSAGSAQTLAQSWGSYPHLHMTVCQHLKLHKQSLEKRREKNREGEEKRAYTELIVLHKMSLQHFHLAHVQLLKPGSVRSGKDIAACAGADRGLH
eukprot:1151268-Pelagomonas_calceolata.AAC.1